MFVSENINAQICRHEKKTPPPPPHELCYFGF
jgi:hypothetical protein